MTENTTKKDALGLLRDENGKLVKSIMNLVLCFEIDENLHGLFHYNEFSASFEYAKDFCWPGHPKPIKKGKRIEDEDVIFIQYYLAHNKRFEMALEKIRNALVENADRYTYHPVREYLDDLKWDKIKRLDEWLIKGCGVDDNVYTREIGRKWLIGAVARIYEPGIKFDQVLVLEGKENIGKSMVLRVLGEPWFTDSISLLQKEQDIVAKMVGNWIVELAEMRGVRKSELEFIKGFISCQVDEQRLAFRRDPKKYYRQSVFAGTSNNMKYLLDEDGNRRFWPANCTAIDIAWMRENKNQLLAEAKAIYSKGIYNPPKNIIGEKLFLEGEALKFARRQQGLRLNTDEVLEEAIERFLTGKDETTMREVVIDCLKYDLKELANRSQVSIVGRILKKLGYEKKERVAGDGSKFKYVREITVSMAEEEW